MKRFSPLVLAAGVLLLSGCHLADVPEASLPMEHDSATAEHGTPGNETPAAHPANGSYPTASAFPSTTPPSGKESVTALGYWGPRKVNTEPTPGHANEAGHTNTAHPGSEGNAGEAGHGESPASH